MANAVLPRNSTRQAEMWLVGDVARLLHPLCGTVILLFVLVHVVVQSIVHVPAWEGLRQSMPWLHALQNQNWVHAILYFSVAFHSLHGLRLMLGDLGLQFDYRRSLWITTGVSALFALREIVRYAGI